MLFIIWHILVKEKFLFFPLKINFYIDNSVSYLHAFAVL